MRQFLLCMLLLLGIRSVSQAQVVYTDFTPDFALRGNEVLLGAEGLDSSASYTVTLNGQPMELLTVESNGLRFRVPDNAISGDVSISVDGSETVLPFPLRVGRNLPVTIDTAAIPDSSGYNVGSIYDDATAGNPWQVPIALGETTLVAATHPDESKTQLMAIATDTPSSIVLGAESTVLAFLFMMPGIQTTDVTAADETLTLLRNLASVQQAIDLVQADINSGIDFLTDDRFDTLLVSAILEYNAAQKFNATTSRPNDSSDDKHRDDTVNRTLPLASGYPRDVPGPINNLFVKNLPSANNSEGIPQHLFAFEGRDEGIIRINPLDWVSFAWRIDPTEFPDGLTDVNNLTNSKLESRVYKRTSTRSTSSHSTKASSAQKKLNLIDLASEFLLGLTPDIAPKDGISIPADRDGVYIVRSYSGAVYGPQDSILNALPEANLEDATMKGVNVVLAVIELISIVAPFKQILGSEALAKIAYRVSREVTASVIRQGNAIGGINARFMLEVFRESAKGVIKDVMKQLLSKGATAVGGLAKSLFKFLDITGKVASVATTLERLAALTNASQLLSENAWISAAMEGSAVVVGNPWAPEINTFEPQTAHKGTLVSIHGARFDAQTPSANIVRFGGLSTDPTNTTGAAEVLAATESNLIVRVPEAAETGPISVARVNLGASSTTGLDAPFAQFQVIPDPVITAIEPASPTAGGLMRIIGENFSPDRDLNRIVYATGFAGSNFSMGATSTGLVVSVPNSEQTDTVTVRIGNRSSNAFTFTPVIRPASDGGVINVTTTADNTAADGEITLREAILIATGTLGRNLTSPPEERPLGVRYETDSVSGTPGAGFRDLIQFQGLAGEVFPIGAPLPDFGNFDTYNFNGIHIQGAGFSSPALAISGNFLTINNVIFSGYTGIGIHITGTAQENRLSGIEIADMGGDGIRIEGNATGNYIFDPKISNAGGAGLRLTGAGVRFNQIQRNATGHPPNDDRLGWFDNCAEWGVIVENGASYNLLAVPHVRNNQLGGILIQPDATDNSIGRPDSSIGNFSQVFDNGGPGVLVMAPRTVIRQLNIAGNSGPGILLEGPQCRNTVVDLVRVGYANITGVAKPNLGSGIHIRGGARQVLIGRKAGSSFGARTSIGGNRDWGILVEGMGSESMAVDVKHSHIGYVLALTQTEIPIPNGLGGIALINSKGCTIGDFEFTLDVHINSHTGGPGILLSGNNTNSNRIIGCQIGSHHDGRPGIGNDTGILVTNGAWGNVIGERGNRLGAFDPLNSLFFDVQPGNVVMANETAGIVLESGGNPGVTLTPEDVPQGGNVIIGNRFGGPADNIEVYQPNGTGIIIREGAKFNRIGGNLPGELNYFLRNNNAGVHIDGGTVTANAVNRIIGNEFTEQGFGEAPGADPAQARPKGVGVLVSNGATGHLIGGYAPGEGNTFRGNVVGVYTEDASEITVASNTFGGPDNGDGNRIAGVVFRDSQNCCLGPHNLIYGNGAEAGSHGGVLLAGGGFHKVLANLVGTDDDTMAVMGNDPHGITIIDSADNRIGDHGAGNTVINSEDSGIKLSGAGAIRNQVAANVIGIDNVLAIDTDPNLGDGIELADGASENIIGGELPMFIKNVRFDVPAGNIIYGNIDHGVAVRGATSLGNRITNNSISSNDGFGILLAAGGNDEIPPPTITELLPGIVKGVVDDGRIPDGSLVQLFSDPDDEGLVMVGEALVVDGKWEVAPGLLPYPNLAATVTHALTEATSEFGPTIIIDDDPEPELRVERVGLPIPETRPIVASNQDQLLFPFVLKTGLLPIRIEGITVLPIFNEGASLQVLDLELWADLDRSGTWSAPDRLISDEPIIDTETGVHAFLELEQSLGAGTASTWLLQGRLADGTFGDSVQFEFSVTESVEAFVWFPISEIEADGDFPVRSDIRVLAEEAAEGWFLF